MGFVRQIEHPLVQCHLTTVRNKNTAPREFRSAIRQLAFLAGIEATRELATETIPVETPLTNCKGFQLKQSVGLVPVLRAGVGMVDAMLELVPHAQVWHLGLYRDESTAKPVRYYNKLPTGNPVDLAFILDPMLATGGSAVMAYETLKEWGASKICMISVIAAPEGIAHVQQALPDIEIYTCTIDERLNENKFIVPGLGDAGDRIFNTSG